MENDRFRINSRVKVTSSAIPNATSFIGRTGTVTIVNGRSVMLLLDDDPTGDPLMFFKRELDLL